jgi:hypothetical protein
MTRRTQAGADEPPSRALTSSRVILGLEIFVRRRGWRRPRVADVGEVEAPWRGEEDGARDLGRVADDSVLTEMTPRR